MPNGLLLEVLANRESTLEAIKHDLWTEAKKNVLYRLLNESNCYIFVSVTQDSKVEEFYDESRRLCDLRLFQPILKLIEPEGNKEEKILSSVISLAIGKPIHELDTIKNAEVIEFRKNIQNVCRNIVEKREALALNAKVLYAFPSELDETNPIESQKLSKLKVCVWVTFADGNNESNLVEVSPDYLCIDLIGDVLEIVYHKSNNLMEDRQKELSQQNKHNFVLKICGFEQYLLGNYPLFRYSVCPIR